MIAFDICDCAGEEIVAATDESNHSKGQSGRRSAQLRQFDATGPHLLPQQLLVAEAKRDSTNICGVLVHQRLGV